ncbi:uncharacterized protein LOC122966172 [Thunnus albacares]|uniref:uncharacterized protein LOC122966172 n=1 Tax=Thunnus albacares TaxID=8236 RepID=UPI001CF698E4|nr:uncharacterized protein LOC122966172 [Thunnus albacares]
MASAGLLLLLLVSSSLILSSLSASVQLGKPKMSRKEKAKKGFKIAAYVLDKGLHVLTPAFEAIPVAGPYLKAISETIQAILEDSGVIHADPTLGVYRDDIAKLKTEFKYVQTKWDTMADQYNKYGNYISRAWTKYTQLEELCADPKKSSEEKQNHINHFKTSYPKVRGYTESLHDLLKNRDLTATSGPELNKFGQVMAQHVRCHVKEIRVFSLLTYLLVNQGIVVSNFMDHLDKVNEAKDLAQIYVDTASALFQIEKYCISNFTGYIHFDVKDLVKDKTDRKKVAENIRSFLEKTYESYDWMVIVFITKHSEKLISRRNLHTTYGFEDIPVDELTVSVAKQVKGTYTKAIQVSHDIKSCLEKNKKKVKCSEVPQTLGDCKTANGHPLLETFTAVHAFIKESHQSTSAKNVEHATKDPEAKTAYFYEGDCVRDRLKPGRFVVLIKSDEEIENKDPCSKKKCGGATKGKCELVENTLIPVCECKGQNYGDKCEGSSQEIEKIMSNTKMSC